MPGTTPTVETVTWRAPRASPSGSSILEMASPGAKKRLARGPAVGLALHRDLGRDGELPRQARPERPGQVGHLLVVRAPAPEAGVDLAAVIRGLAPRGHELFPAGAIQVQGGHR